MKKIDTHIHTRFSLDSEENPEHYILKALELGLDEICFTDHYDVAYPGADFTMNIPEYMAHMTSLQKKYQNQLKIYIGIEMGLDPIHKDEIELLLKKYPFDFVIGSIHAIGHQEFFQGDYFRGKTKYEAHDKYFKQCLECVKTFDCFDVFGHYDYIERYGIYDDNSVDNDSHWEIIDEFLKLIIAKDKGLEVNTSGFRLRQESFPKRRILERYHALGGTKITIGSDSHSVDTLGGHIDEVIAMLKDIGFDTVGLDSMRKYK